MKNLILMLLLLLQAPGPPPASLRDTTAAIAKGAATAERRAAIADRLKAAGVNFQVQDFTEGTRSGTNLAGTIPGRAASTTLLLGAHYDRVARGQGAVDNAASCAMLLNLIERLKASPLTNTTVTVAFFDLEEVGLVGSRAYLKTLDASARPAYAMNFDIFGYGETFFVAPLKADGQLMASFQQAASELGFPVRSVPMTQYPASDHRSMALAGVETVGVALIDGTEIDSVLKPGPVPPRILGLIHTEADTVDQIREQDMAKAVPVIERAIRLLDEKFSAH